MTSAPTLSAPAAPKAVHSSPSKNAPTKCKNTAKADFDSQLNDAAPETEDIDNKDVKDLSGDPEIALTPSEPEPTAHSPETDSTQTLFPSQMNIIAPEVIKPDPVKNTDSGSIFQKQENNSPSLFSTPSVPATLNKNISSTQVAPSPTTAQAGELTSLVAKSTLSLESIDTPKPSSTNPSLESLTDSVAETPLSTEINPKLSELQTTPVQPESLKSATTQAKPESITLSSQHHLETVLDSVFEEKPLPTPRRIEVKLQTPQGSQITLYIARVNQELRAQFSANSNQAFAWLQNEIHQLRSLNSGESVRWLPAQIESSLPKAASSEKSSKEGLGKEKDRESDSPLESIFDLFKPSTRRLA
jgi:hypothetical protein